MAGPGALGEPVTFSHKACVPRGGSQPCCWCWYMGSSPVLQEGMGSRTQSECGLGLQAGGVWGSSALQGFLHLDCCQGKGPAVLLSDFHGVLS